MKALLPVLFWAITLPCFADYTTPGTFVKWTLDDLVANSAGNVTSGGGEYNVNGIITIATNDTISITADAVVRFAASTHFLVNGTIIIDPPNNVTFTAQNQVSGFNGIRLDFSAASRFKKLTFEYASSFNIRDCSPVIDSCLFQYNNNSTTFGSGTISLFRSNAVIRNSTFLHNKRAVIYGASNINNAPKVTGCYFEDNVTLNINTPQINLGATSASGTDTAKILNNTLVGGYILSGAISFFAGGNVYALIKGNIIRKNRYGINLQGGSAINALLSYNVIDSNNNQNDPMMGGSGIAFSGGSASSHQNSIVTGNIFRGNLWGITIQNGAKPNLGDLSNSDTSDNGKNWFSGNTNSSTPGIHLYNNSPDAIMAQGNYWDSNDPAVIEAGIFHQPDNAALGLVDYSSYVLPVQLVSFSGSVNDKEVNLRWQTSSEVNSNYFLVEKSSDGSSFEKIGMVGAAGNSNSPRNYAYDDRSFTNRPDVFYRLKLVDKDGKYKYSPVIVIKASRHDGDVRLFPTTLSPGGELHLETNVARATNLSVCFYDAAGRMLKVAALPVNAGKNNIVITDMPVIRGNLLVRISCSEFTRVVRVTIN
jgi:hypothetical protein